MIDDKISATIVGYRSKYKVNWQISDFADVVFQVSMLS